MLPFIRAETKLEELKKEVAVADAEIRKSLDGPDH